MKKVGTIILITVLGLVLILTGVYCGIKWFQDAHRTSNVIGSLEVSNKLVQESFSFSSATKEIVFYHDDYDETDLYTFTAELPAVSSFDGTKNNYEIRLNNYLVLESKILFRMVQFRVYINFKDVDDTMLCETSFEVEVRFLADKTNLTIKVNGDRDCQYIERYIECNGFELFINEVIKGESK